MGTQSAYTPVYLAATHHTTIDGIGSYKTSDVRVLKVIKPAKDTGDNNTYALITWPVYTYDFELTDEQVDAIIKIHGAICHERRMIVWVPSLVSISEIECWTESGSVMTTAEFLRTVSIFTVDEMIRNTLPYMYGTVSDYMLPVRYVIMVVEGAYLAVFITEDGMELIKWVAALYCYLPPAV